MIILRNSALALLTLVLVLLVQQFLFCPRYQFPDPTPFSGQNFYNPYSNADSTAWRISNFHAHSHSWGGVTNGKGTAKDIWNAYDSLGYTFHSISQYHNVNTEHFIEPNYIPAYEHGYNIKKTHHLVLGDTKVTWLDYVFPQTTWNKQWVIDRLSSNPANLVILNHPAVRNGYEFEDLKLLTGYRCMEVLNPAARSFAQWDAALSAGKEVFIIGNDDIHNVFNVATLGRFCTVINTKKIDQGSAISALKAGNSYGVSIAKIADETLGAKSNRLRNEIPFLKSLTVRDGAINVRLSEKAQEIVFVGDNGSELARISNSETGIYQVNSNDSYVRTEAKFPDGTTLYLNPIYRYERAPFQEMKAAIDPVSTFLFRLFGILILVSWSYVIYTILPGRISRHRLSIPLGSRPLVLQRFRVR